LKCKVLFVVSSLEVGGIEMYLLRFLEFCQKELHSVVLCRSGKKGTLFSKYEDLGVKVDAKYINYLSMGNHFWLYSYLKRNNFDAICDFSGDFSGLILLLGKIIGVKKRISFYRESEYQFKRTMLKSFYAQVLNYLVKKNATAILSNSKVALNNFHPKRGLDGGKYKVIDNGVPFIKTSIEERTINRYKFKIPKNSIVIGHLGRYIAAKNHNYILSLVDVIVEKYPNVYFLLHGKGVEDAVNKISGNYVHNKHIITPGVCTDLVGFFSTIDLFVFPSINEGQPNALLEAMISKTPVIANSIESVKEIVPDEASIALFDGTINNFHIKIQAFLNLKKTQKLYDYSFVSNEVRKNHSPEEKFKEFLSELSV
jgi:glycosyltransferase involved in cell wall biosynthesis